MKVLQVGAVIHIQLLHVLLHHPAVLIALVAADPQVVLIADLPEAPMVEAVAQEEDVHQAVAEDSPFVNKHYTLL